VLGATVGGMTSKPSDRWRGRVAEEQRQVAAGRLDPAQAYTVRLFPESLLTATDAALQSFETELAALRDPSDQQVFAAVERVVLVLNTINTDHHRGAYETGEREELCDYIDRTLGEHGIDVPALASRNGIGAHEITDEWREW
jgi:hypothetical protein